MFNTKVYCLLLIHNDYAVPTKLYAIIITISDS